VVQTTCGTDGNCNGGLSDAFVSVIKPGGGSFVYSTFLGGSSGDEGLAIAVDSAGNAYVTGSTLSSDFPTHNPAFSKYGGVQDAFVTALNPTGSALLYSTYLGGSSADAGTGIAVDGSQNAYVTGQTGSSDFPVGHATQVAIGGGSDAFVTEIRPAGTLVFSTFLGGTGNENTTAAGAGSSPVGGIAVDSAGANIYVTGNTASSNFPATSGALQTTIGSSGIFDAFVAKYSQTGAPGNFTVTNGALSVTSGNPGVSATSTITVTSTNNFNAAVALACSVAPVVSNGPTCSFSNPGSSVTPPANSSTTATLTVSTTAASAFLQHPSDRRSSGIFYAILMPVGATTLLGAGFGAAGSPRKKLFGFLMLGLLLCGLLLTPACGGGSSTKNTNTGTPAGAYTITVTGTNGAAVATGTPALTLTVN
jgi:hypothetical protein